MSDFIVYDDRSDELSLEELRELIDCIQSVSPVLVSGSVIATDEKLAALCVRIMMERHASPQ